MWKHNFIFLVKTFPLHSTAKFNSPASCNEVLFKNEVSSTRFVQFPVNRKLRFLQLFFLLANTTIGILTSQFPASSN